MGGTTRPVVHRGERREVEHNFSCNPRAAATVVRTCRGATIVPLDVTARMTLDDDECAAITEAVPALRNDVDAWRAGTGNPICLHDPLALLVLLGDAPVEIADRSLEVRGPGTLYVMADGGERHPLVIDVDAPAAVTRVLEIVGYVRREAQSG